MKKLALIFILLPGLLFGSEKQKKNEQLMQQRIQKLIAAERKKIESGDKLTITWESLDYPEVVEFLIMAGADVDQQIESVHGSKYPETILTNAILRRLRDTVRLLLQHKANPLLDSYEPMPSIRETVRRGQSRPKPRRISYNAYEAAASSSAPEIKKLLKEYAQQHGQTQGNPLFKEEESEQRTKQFVQGLIAEERKKIDGGNKPTITYDSLRYPEVVEFLIMAGADVNEYILMHKTEMTPLIAVIFNQNLPIKTLQLLLQHKADPSIRSNKLTTINLPLYRKPFVYKRPFENAYEFAAKQGRPEIINLLREYAQQHRQTYKNPLFKEEKHKKEENS